MSTAVTKATFRGTEWAESSVVEEAGLKLAKIQDRYVYSGSIQGESVSTGTVTYLPGDGGNFVGYELFTGSVEGKRGSFVLCSTGGFAPDAVHAELRIVDGSGTGELAGLSGSGTMHFPMTSKEGTVELSIAIKESR